MTAPREIERRFLISDLDYLLQVLDLVDHKSQQLEQGYLSLEYINTVRVRIDHTNARAMLTCKGPRGAGSCVEIESNMDVDAAALMLEHMRIGDLVKKIRHSLVDNAQAVVWEVDQFLAQLSPLWIVEVEVPRIDLPLVLPSWVGREITNDPRYSNASLALYGIPSSS